MRLHGMQLRELVLAVYSCGHSSRLHARCIMSHDSCAWLMLGGGFGLSIIHALKPPKALAAHAQRPIPVSAVSVPAEHIPGAAFRQHTGGAQEALPLGLPVAGLYCSAAHMQTLPPNSLLKSARGQAGMKPYLVACQGAQASLEGCWAAFRTGPVHGPLCS